MSRDAFLISVKKFLDKEERLIRRSGSFSHHFTVLGSQIDLFEIHCQTTQQAGYEPVPGSQIMGKSRKKKAGKKLAGRKKAPPLLSPVSSRIIFVFALSQRTRLSRSLEQASRILDNIAALQNY